MFAAVNNPYLPKLAAGFVPEDIAACIKRALALSVRSRRKYGSKARQRYLQEQRFFVAKLHALQREADALVKSYWDMQSKHNQSNTQADSVVRQQMM